MTWLAFVASVIGSLAWPTAMVVFVLAFRPQFAAILGRLTKAKGFGGELEFAQGLDKAETLAPPTTEPPRLPAPNLPRIGHEPSGLFRARENADLPPDYRVTYAWKLIVAALSKAAESHGYPVRNIFDRRELRGLGSALGLTDNEISQIDQLRQLRNRAAHEIENTITTTDALRYEDLVLGLLERLEIMQGKPDKA